MDNLARAALDRMVSELYDAVDDEDKPLLKVILNRSEMFNLMQQATERIQRLMVDREKNAARSIAINVNSVMESAIENLKKVIEENA